MSNETKKIKVGDSVTLIYKGNDSEIGIVRNINQRSGLAGVAWPSLVYELIHYTNNLRRSAPLRLRSHDCEKTKPHPRYTVHRWVDMDHPKEIDCGHGMDEYTYEDGSYLYDNKAKYIVASDGMESEDVTFSRDLKWIHEQLNRQSDEIDRLHSVYCDEVRNSRARDAVNETEIARLRKALSNIKGE